ncbi:hypothetical protein K493DRAFT_305279 [Basidiobolus meristosporus CBS 931.73]|uniref:Uncharacterized protein n=1 Tax=Basidiobolus meristosporus CBS 931.73 TaxID=1314790 RepID=A0A1Y1XWB3_9FUNG|nr:hypothetical protein K493DRAFT_305279 [Basidiobolus meristosporus CBS 931.73]|eukprot:ORX90039.1 hypothetical protein K493DRAFT_305279 [Basidiobolus meristosporus CBS 931.73]
MRFSSSRILFAFSSIVAVQAAVIRRHNGEDHGTSVVSDEKYNQNTDSALIYNPHDIRGSGSGGAGPDDNPVKNQKSKKKPKKCHKSKVALEDHKPSPNSASDAGESHNDPPKYDHDDDSGVDAYDDSSNKYEDNYQPESDYEGDNAGGEGDGNSNDYYPEKGSFDEDMSTHKPDEDGGAKPNSEDTKGDYDHPEESGEEAPSIDEDTPSYVPGDDTYDKNVSEEPSQQNIDSTYEGSEGQGGGYNYDAGMNDHKSGDDCKNHDKVREDHIDIASEEKPYCEGTKACGQEQYPASDPYSPMKDTTHEMNASYSGDGGGSEDAYQPSNYSGSGDGGSPDGSDSESYRCSMSGDGGSPDGSDTAPSAQKDAYSTKDVYQPSNHSGSGDGGSPAGSDAAPNAQNDAYSTKDVYQPSNHSGSGGAGSPTGSDAAPNAQNDAYSTKDMYQPSNYSGSGDGGSPAGSDAAPNAQKDIYSTKGEYQPSNYSGSGDGGSPAGSDSAPMYQTNDYSVY